MTLNHPVCRRESASLLPNPFSSAVIMALLTVLGCSSEEGSGDGRDTGGSGASATGGASGNPAGGAGGIPNLCPEDPGITACGSEICSPVEANLASICVQNCCTSDMKCGTRNAIASTECVAKVTDTAMCPNVTLFGMQVPGCCVPNETLCGVQDVSGLFGGGCVPRCRLAAISSEITNVSCADGMPAGACTTAGAGGMGGGDSGAGGTGNSSG